MAKNIVILSDGTGNAAASRTPTNVWRLYQALDLSDPEKQVAFYDDGVGTERWRPLKMIGGGFGYGLKDNVLEMYRFLSRSYEDDDRIFVYGFSRGAYTVRVLVGLIHHCGLIRDAESGPDLEEISRQRYKDFRKRFSNLRTRIQRGLLPKRDGRREDGSGWDLRPEIAFLGVWDTVDAYGMPIDEMAVAWDRFVYPYRFPDRKLSPLVRQAAHALALDDERLTFHPVLWDEGERSTNPDGTPGSTAESQRIRQVWFAGVHANVGGGYPDDTLAHVPLDWMLSEIEDDQGNSPLIFLPGARDAIARRADIRGKLYDSRSGLQAYYRFKPRNVAETCADRDIDVTADIRIHESVFARIGNSALQYAPFAISTDYEVIPTRRWQTPPVFETPDGKERRARALEHVWDYVHWRRWLYIFLVATTIFLVASPWILSWSEVGDYDAGSILCLPQAAVELVSPLLPGWSERWQKALGQNPAVLVILIAIFVFQWIASGRLRATVARRAAAAWRLSLGEAAPDAEASRADDGIPVFTSLTRRLRTLCTGRCAKVRNWALAIAAFILMFVAAVVAADKIFDVARAACGLACTSTETKELGAREAPATAKLDPADQCLATGLRLVAGREYTITVAPADRPTQP